MKVKPLCCNIGLTHYMKGPYGTGMSGPSFGLCPVDRDWMTERYNRGESGMSWMSAPPEAPRGRDDTDQVMTKLALKKISAFSGIGECLNTRNLLTCISMHTKSAMFTNDSFSLGHGYYFWNFRTDLYNPQWSYMLALERGWIPRGDLKDERILNSCDKEDEGAFLCEANRDAPEDTIRSGMAYALEQEKKSTGYIYKLHGDDLYDEADTIYSEFWVANRAKGATCDFGGGATLVEANKTHTEDYYNDDYYNVIEVNEFPVWKIVLFAVLGVVVGGLVGFTAAMKMSPRFNRAVRSSVMLRPVTSSRVFRQSFGNLLEPGFTGIDMDD